MKEKGAGILCPLLAHYAGECVECGACETRCLFQVPVMENMKAAKAMFGK